MSETGTHLPEAFQRAAADWEKKPESDKTQEADPEAIKKANEIKNSILNAIGDKWTPTNGGREYRGFLEDPKNHISVVQKFGAGMEGLMTLEIHLNQYKPGQRISTTVLFLNQQRGGVINWYGFEAERKTAEETKGETDTTKSLFWANFEGDKVVGHQETNPKEGLQFASEIRDALTGKAIAQKPTKFSRRRLLGLEK